MQWTDELIEQAQAFYDSGLQPHDVASKFGKHVRASDVRAVIDCHRARATDPALIAKIQAIRISELLSFEMIARRLGIQACTVERACRGVVLPDGSVIKKMSNYGGSAKRDKAAAKRVQVPVYEPVQIPTWVPGQLHDLYESIAERDCEEQAAIVCRTLKRGGSVAWL